MAENKIIMAWSECLVEISAMGDSEAMGLVLESIGTIKDKSTSLEATDGDTLTMKATGGKTVAEEEGEGDFILKTRVIEPTDELYTKLGLGVVSSKKYNVKTHVVSGDFSVKVTPKNIGAKGIEAPKCHIKFKPGYSEEDGNYADLEFKILKGMADYWYARFTKEAAPSENL